MGPSGNRTQHRCPNSNSLYLNDVKFRPSGAGLKFFLRWYSRYHEPLITVLWDSIKFQDVLQLLYNYFKNKTSYLRNSSRLLQKRSTKCPRDSFKLLQKPDNGSPRFFQTTSQTRHKESPRFLQTTWKTKRRDPRHSFKIIQKQWGSPIFFKIT